MSRFFDMSDLDDNKTAEYLLGLSTKDVLEWYFNTKRALGVEEAAFAERTRPFTKQLELLQWLVTRKMDQEDVKTLSAASGRVTRVDRTTYQVVDSEALANYATSNDCLHIFKLNPIKEEYEALLDQFQRQGHQVDNLPGVEKKVSSSLRFTPA